MSSLIPAPKRQRHALAPLLALSCMLGAFCPILAAAATPPGDVATVHAQTFTRSLHAYGQVAPIAVVPVRAIDPGTLSGLRVVPGSAVVAGEVLARMRGPRLHSLLTTREQGLHRAQAQEQAASRDLKIERHLLSTQLATRQAVDAAQSALAAAQAAERIAAVQLREARDWQTVRAPAAGTVVALQAAGGEQIMAGDPILTLQPAGRLWVRAVYYGAEAALLRVGMSGRFQPADDNRSIPVKVAAIAPAIASDGGRRVGLMPTATDASLSPMTGQWGTVTLKGPSQQMISVPTSALILDRGKWWVLVHTRQGNHPQRVVPGPAQGWQTRIASGLTSGQEIVVRDAFLEYHRGIARSYQPPD